MGMGMGVDVGDDENDENEGDMPASVPGEIQLSTPSKKGTLGAPVDSPGSKRNASGIGYLTPTQLREQRRISREMGERPSSLPGGNHLESELPLRSQNLQELAGPLKSTQSPRKPYVIIPVYENQGAPNEELSVQRTSPGSPPSHPKRGSARCRTAQRELRTPDSKPESENEEPAPVFDKTPKRSSPKRRRKSILERELDNVVPPVGEDEDQEPTPTVETSPKKTKKSILERELGIIPSADESSFDLQDESRSRQTSSLASDRITQQAQFDAAPINVFDRYLGESDVELPGSRRSPDAQAYVKKEGYKKLIGVRSRYPTSEAGSVFDPSEERRRYSMNATPLRDTKLRQGSGSAINPKSLGQRKLIPMSSQNILSFPDFNSRHSRNLSGSPVKRTQRRLFNNKSEIPSSSAEESGSEMVGSQQDLDLTANKGNTNSSLNNIRVNRAMIYYPTGLPLFGIDSTVSGCFDYGFAIPKYSPPITSTSTEHQIKSPATTFLDKMQLDTSRKFDSAYISSPVVTRMKRNKATDFFDLYDDYKPRTPPPSEVSFQGEPKSMTVCGDTQRSIEEPASCTVRGDDTKLSSEEEPALKSLAQLLEEPSSVTVRGNDTQLPVVEEALASLTQLVEEPISMAPPGPPVEEQDSMTVRGDDTQLSTVEPPLMKPTLDALFRPCSPPDSSASSYYTARSHQDNLYSSQEFKSEVTSPLKVTKAKAKRQPAKSPYFKQLVNSPKKRSKIKVAETDGLETPRTPKKESTSSPGKRSPAGIASCIPFPPLSSPTFGLIQEKLAHDPFRLLIAVTFLNRTKGKQAIPVFYELVEKFPTPEALASAPREDIVSIIRHLGLQNQRAETFQTYGKQWLEENPAKDKRYPVKGYPKRDSGRDIERGEVAINPDRHTEWEIGHMTQGPYAIDSWRIFCRDVLREVADSWTGENAKEMNFQPEWMRVLPEDKELRAYLRWMWLKEGFHWDPFTGDKEVAQPDLMEAAMKGKIAWTDLGGMRILGDEYEQEMGEVKKKEEDVDTGKEDKKELGVDMGGVDGPPV